jgi:signal transduction histidine kinase
LQGVHNRLGMLPRFTPLTMENVNTSKYKEWLNDEPLVIPSLEGTQDVAPSRSSMPSVRSKFTLLTTSVRSKIYLLAVLTCVVLVGAATILYILLRNNQSSILNATQNHLGTLSRTLAQNYASRSAWELQHPGHPYLEEPANPTADYLLSLVTSSVLMHEGGIEGGFYSRTSDTLLGYAFPTHELGVKREISAGDRPTIIDLARKAAKSGQMQTLRFRGARDAIIFVAYPVTSNGSVIGATWMMRRLPGLAAGNHLRMIVGMAAFAMAALFCAVIAFLVVADVQSAVQSITAYLHRLGTDLATHRPEQLKLAEFEGLLQNVDSLAATLRRKNENEHRLESKLRHQERLSSLGQFAAGIAHEIRNPLATIRLRTQMSQRSTADSAVQRNSEIALEEIARLDAMITRLLYFSRPVRLDREQIDLAMLCHAVAESHRSAAVECGIEIEIFDSDRVSVFADPNHLRQVLDNVFVNAMEALQTGPQSERHIYCRVRSENEWAEIQVEDSGAGFAPGAVAHAIDPFFTTKQNGTGLGLSIAYEILQAHGGQIVLTNREQGGAVVTLRIPIESSFLVELIGSQARQTIESLHG